MRREPIELIVTADAAECHALQIQIGDPERIKDLRVTYPGATPCGVRFSRVLVTSYADHRLKWDREASVWFREAIEPRLENGGRIIYLR